MLVSTYQIHNVLNVYSKQLSQDKSTQKLKAGNKRNPADQISLSAEGKRRAMIEKVAQEIISKISHYGDEHETQINKQDISRQNDKNRYESGKQKEGSFVFNVIDALNKKTTTALSVKDTGFLVNKLEQLAKDAVEKDADI